MNKLLISSMIIGLNLVMNEASAAQAASLDSGRQGESIVAGDPGLSRCCSADAGTKQVPFAAAPFSSATFQSVAPSPKTVGVLKTVASTSSTSSFSVSPTAETVRRVTFAGDSQTAFKASITSGSTSQPTRSGSADRVSASATPTMYRVPIITSPYESPEPFDLNSVLKYYPGKDPSNSLMRAVWSEDLKTVSHILHDQKLDLGLPFATKDKEETTIGSRALEKAMYIASKEAKAAKKPKGPGYIRTFLTFDTEGVIVNTMGCMIADLVTSGANLNKLDGNGYTPVMHAINHGDLPLLKLMLDQPGVDLTIQSPYFMKEDALGMAESRIADYMQIKGEEKEIRVAIRDLVKSKMGK